MKEHLQTGSFLQAFCDKGRMRSVLQNIPVHVIMSSTAALFGAAVLALNPSSGAA
jgi:glucokinase